MNAPKRDQAWAVDRHDSAVASQAGFARKQAREPAIKPGFTRLYRGHGGANVRLPEWALTNAGEWFSSLRRKGEDFQTMRNGTLSFIDVPTKDLQQFRAPSGNASDEYLINKTAQANLGVGKITGENLLSKFQAADAYQQHMDKALSLSQRASAAERKS